jgi:hypothetical protein
VRLLFIWILWYAVAIEIHAGAGAFWRRELECRWWRMHWRSLMPS